MEADSKRRRKDKRWRRSPSSEYFSSHSSKSKKDKQWQREYESSSSRRGNDDYDSSYLPKRGHDKRNSSQSSSSKEKERTEVTECKGREQSSSSRVYKERYWSRDESKHSMKRDISEKHFSEEAGPRSKKGKSCISTEHEDVTFDFSFYDYRRELNRIFFHDNSLVQDLDDFWKFVKKFEAVQRKKQESIPPYGSGGNIIQTAFSKFNFLGKCTHYLHCSLLIWFQMKML